MSNIYIQEPATAGKVLLVTSVGDIDIELWSKEAPKACRNFVQLCMEGYYNETKFHRVVKDFIVQGGDPTNTGSGGESIYGAPFKDEFHPRLRFIRRGLVAMANAGPHDNGSQFFFTLAETPELQNKHTVFGKVTGPTLYNMIKLQEVEIGADDKPLYPHKIIKAEILSNPYDDIIPRQLKKPTKEKEEDKKVKSKSKATKNFSLLSFGDEAEKDEDQAKKASKKFSGKSKSSHDLANDPNLLSVTAMETDVGDDHVAGDAVGEKRKAEGADVSAGEIKNKLKKDNTPAPPVAQGPQHEPTQEEIKKNRKEDIKREQKKLKKEMKAAKKASEQRKQKDLKPVVVDAAKEEKPAEEPSNDLLEAFKAERRKFKNLKKEQPKKGSDREAHTLALLQGFQTKLQSVKQLTTGYSDDDDDDEEGKEDDVEDENNDISWMKHKLQFENEETKKKVLDANVTELDRYDVFDPRNPLTQRRKEASKQKAREKRDQKTKI